MASLMDTPIIGPAQAYMSTKDMIDQWIASQRHVQQQPTWNPNNPVGTETMPTARAAITELAGGINAPEWTGRSP